MKPILLAFLLSLFLPPSGQDWTVLEEKGMTLKYRFVEGSLEVEMHSPRQGWVAVGFNPEAGLTNTHLIMGAVEGEEVNLSERHVVRPGNYPSIASLDGEKAVELFWGSADQDGTTIGFRMPAGFADRYRHPLSPGQAIHLTLAFSMEDDFLHHSIMRTSIQITL